MWSLCLTLLRGPCLRNFFPGHYWRMLWKNECTPQPQPVPHSQNRMIKTMVSCRLSLKPIYMVKAPLILTNCGSHVVAYQQLSNHPDFSTQLLPRCQGAVSALTSWIVRMGLRCLQERPWTFYPVLTGGNKWTMVSNFHHIPHKIGNQGATN